MEVNIGGSNATRTALVTHVLAYESVILAYLELEAYIEPTPKIPITMIFRSFDMCSRKTMGIGRMMTMISVMMFSTPVAMYNAALFKHCPSVTVTSMFFANGSHAASKEMTMLTEDPTTTNMVKLTPARKLRAGLKLR